MKARRATIELIYEGKNITKDIAKDLIEFTYTDNASGSADDVSITLKDPDGKWISSWAPQRGDIIKPTIKTVNWRWEGDSQQMKCGTYLVDEPSYSGRPRTLTIGAVSVPANTDFMNTPKSEIWDMASIKEIARSIAEDAGLQLYYDSKQDPVVDFLEQSEVPNASFLFDLCKKYSLAMKLYDNRIVIFDEAEYEKKPTVAIICENPGLVSSAIKKPQIVAKPSWSAKTSFTETGFDGCQVVYTDPEYGELLEHTFMAPGRKGNKIYILNEEVFSIAEAEIRAKSKLRELNRSEYVMTILIPGNLDLVASQTVDVKGFGVFDGKYFIDRITRKLGDGFDCTLELHRVLEGY